MKVDEMSFALYEVLSVEKYPWSPKAHEYRPQVLWSIVPSIRPRPECLRSHGQPRGPAPASEADSRSHFIAFFLLFAFRRLEL